MTERLIHARASCAGGLEFKTRTGQILHGVAKGLPSLQHLRKQQCCLVVVAVLWRLTPL